MATRAQPLPLPTHPAHRLHSAASSSSSSSSSFSSSSSLSTASSPSTPSPRTTSVPFSWEHHPGIPKNRGGADPAVSSPRTPLPLPPPLRRRANRPACGARPEADPFAAALAECTRERASGGNFDVDIEALFRPTPASAAAATAGARAGSSRRWSVAAGGVVVGFLDLYGCKSAMGAVAEGAFVVRRPVVAAVSRRGRRPGGRR